jgi:hypothetical protein
MVRFFPWSSIRACLAGGARAVRPAILPLILASLLAAGEARAADPSRLEQGKFSIDLFQGPLLAPISVTGMAGAYAAYAEGISGFVANAASPAVREPFSVSNFEIDGSGSISLPISLFENNDFDNSGSLDYDYSNFLYGTLGGIIQYGPFGAGINAELQRYTLTDAQSQTTNVLIGKYHLLGAVNFLRNQLVVGGGARFATLGIDSPEGTFTMIGAAPELGVLIRPDWQSFRVGATVRLPVEGVPVPGLGNGRPVGLALPGHVVLPWEIEVGVAVQIGPRPLNPAWIDPEKQEGEVRASFRRRAEERARRRRDELAQILDPVARGARERELVAAGALAQLHDEREESRALGVLKQERRARYWNWPREHLLLTAELLVTGAVNQGVSIQTFLGQNEPSHDPTPGGAGSSGASVNFSPRFGVETEPVPDRVHTRFGTYYEPSRFGDRVGRQHFTFGADLKLFHTTWFGLVPEVIYKIQASADMSPRYQSISLGAGVWH